MLNLPVRVELKCDLEGVFCRFTVDSLPFGTPPVKGDPIDFVYPNWPIRVLALVQYVYHTVGPKPGSIVCCSCSFPSQTEMIQAFDLFKDTVKIHDPDTGGTRPPPYYPAYRLIYKIWGKKSFSHGEDHPSVLAEIMKACIVAGGGGDDLKLIVKGTEFVHKLLIEQKQRLRGEDYDLMTFMRDWDKDTKMAAFIGQAEEVLAMEASKKVLSSFKSIPVDKWPASLRS